MAYEIDAATAFDDSQTLMQLENVKLQLGHDALPHPGTLTVADSAVQWWSQAAGRGYSISYSDLMIHAVARDAESFAQPCLYCQLDLGDDDDEGDEGERPPQPAARSAARELRFIPADASKLDELYAAICEGQALNPPADEDGDDEDYSGEGHAWITAENAGALGLGGENGEDDDDDGVMVGGLNAEGQATLARLNAMLQASVEAQGIDGEQAEEENAMYEDAD